MSEQKEKLFVEKFICKNYRDRISYELNSKKKRENAIMRFCHDIENLIDTKKIKKIYNRFDICELVKFFNKKDCYVLSARFIEGKEMQAECALHYMEKESLSVIILCDPICLIKNESEGCSTIYILEDK